MKIIPVLLLFVSIPLFGYTNSVNAENRVFLKLDGIEGESIVAEHEGEIDVLSWRWQLSATGSMYAGGGTSMEKAIVRPVIITKSIDKSSPLIALTLLKGSAIASAILSVRRAGDDPIDYARIKMWDVRILNLSSENDGTTIVESVALGFSRICYEYTIQNADGTPGGMIEKCWDLAANAEP